MMLAGFQPYSSAKFAINSFAYLFVCSLVIIRVRYYCRPRPSAYRMAITVIDMID